MPRETIRRLQRDVERVLIAGAQLAAGDGDLAKDRAALDALATQLAAKAPVIGHLAAATGKLMTAGSSAAARELVSLATMTAQVRCAQATLAPVAALQPLAVRPPIGTPCKAKDLGEVYNALIESGKGRLEKIDHAIASRQIADLRLVDALVFAMGDSWIGERITKEAIPLLGPAIVAPIRARLSIEQGRSVDGRRLRALVAVQKREAYDLLQAALTSGTAVMREAAFTAIADHVRGEPEFEPLALDALATDRSGEVRLAALRALGGYASEASMTALVGALDDVRTHRAAAEGLGASKHPQVVTWLLTRLEAAVSAEKTAAKAAKEAEKEAAKEAASTATTAPSKPAKPAKATTVVAPADMVATLLDALARHQDPRIAPAAVALLADHGHEAAQAVLTNGTPAQVKLVADLLSSSDEAVYRWAAQAAVALGPVEAYVRFTAQFSAKDSAKKVGQSRLAAIGAALRGSTDPRWSDFALKQLAGPFAIAVHLLPVLAAAKDTRAVKPLLAALTTIVDVNHQCAIIDTLGELGDPAAITPILEQRTPRGSTRQGHSEYRVMSAVSGAILAINHVSAVDQVRSIVAALPPASGYNEWYLRHLLDQLEQRFPGK